MQSPLDPRFAGAQRFQGKVCVITGSGQGIGAATARRLGSEGGIIALADRSEPGVTRVGEQLTANGVESMTFIGDLGDWDTCQRLMNEVQAQYGHIDVLVNNVGGGGSWGSPVVEDTAELVWKEVYEGHVARQLGLCHQLGDSGEHLDLGLVNDLEAPHA